MTDETLTDLTDETNIAIDYEPVRARGETRRLETTVVENGLTPDDDAVYLAEYHSENDRYPRRRLRMTDDGVVVEARRSTEDGTLWAAYSTPGADVVRLAVTAAPEAAPAAAD